MIPQPRARAIADAIAAGYHDFLDEFREITRHAEARFRQRLWSEARADSLARLRVYRGHVDPLVQSLRAELGDTAQAPMLWLVVRHAFLDCLPLGSDRPLAETFYNSVQRRLASTVGCDHHLEFVPHLGRPCNPVTGPAPYRRYVVDALDAPLVARLMSQLLPGVEFEDLGRDSELAAAALRGQLGPPPGDEREYTLEFLEPVFYRNKGAYLIGRQVTPGRVRPVVFALLNPPGGAVIDAVLTSRGEVGVVFSFSWSPFHVAVEEPGPILAFLRSVMPQKHLYELYNALGFDRHAKTELYSLLHEHLQRSTSRFVKASGTEGLVMAVFTLPSLNVVFKMIKDTFGDGKRATTNALVRDRYRLVFEHDRVGRLSDFSQFEQLEFHRDRFRPELLEYLTQVAGRNVVVHGDAVVVRHLYAQRRVVPLNLYLRTATDAEAERVVLDYGQSIKDMAMAGIFPGDMLQKNFGVTRNRRVVFYDYDEISMLDDVRFRRIPPSRGYEEELSPTPWFRVAEDDVFPEEFSHFFTFRPPLDRLFRDAHPELSDAAWWKDIQARWRTGELLDFFPYPAYRRLHT